MTPSLSRRQTLRESLPSFFETNKSSWPSPVDSIGQECLRINGLRCWQVIGPALEAMEKLSLPIKDLLDKHQELLEQGESKPRAVSFNMWMIGHLPVSADPTVVFSSKSKRQRTCAKALLKESKLLDDYPGIKIKTLDKMPAIYQSAEQTPATFPDNVWQNGVYMIDDSRGPCGALIAFGHSTVVTMGGILIIGGVRYGISAQHARLGSSPEQEDRLTDSEPPCFDDDSDSESDDLIEITSKASVSSDEEVGTDSFGSLPTDSVFDLSYRSHADTQNRCNIQNGTSSVQPQYMNRRQISSLSISCFENDLDYEIFPVDDPHLQGHNSMRLPENQGSAQTLIHPNHCVRNLVESKVWAATGTTGLVSGTILRTPYYIKMERSQTFQEMWAVKLDRKTMQGDCGAWVVDALTGGIYGHIIAGDPLTGLAFIIPAYKIFDDIELRFGTEPRLPTKTMATVAKTLLASTNSRRQLSPSVHPTPEAVLRLVTAWLFWTSQNVHVPPQERQQFILSILSSKTFGECLRALKSLVDPVDYVYLSFEAESTLQQSQGRHNTSFVFQVVGLYRHRLCLTRYANGHDVKGSYQRCEMVIDRQAYDHVESLGSMPAIDYQSSPSGPSRYRCSKLVENYDRWGFPDQDQDDSKNPYGEAILTGGVATSTWFEDQDALLQGQSDTFSQSAEQGVPITYSFGSLGSISSSLGHGWMEQNGKLLASSDLSASTLSRLPALPDLQRVPAMLQCPFNFLRCDAHLATEHSDDWHRHTLTHFGDHEPWTGPLRQWPAKKKRVRRSSDKHFSSSVRYRCQLGSCHYKCKRKGKCEEHMEKAHGWAYDRSKPVKPCRYAPTSPTPTLSLAVARPSFLATLGRDTGLD